jgi:hypothetical protein
MTHRIVAELHNDVDNPDFSERRQKERRESFGRRAADLAENKCAIHDEAMKRRDERCKDRRDECDTRFEQQRDINKELFKKVDLISNKLNWILGAAFIGWPIIQILIQQLLKK